MKDDVQILQKRAIRYWHIDGISEIAFGIVCLLLGIYFFLIVWLPQPSLLHTLITFSMAILFLGLTFVGKRLINLVKTRLTYPRTGYVSYEKPTRKRYWLTGVVAMLMAALLAILILSYPVSTNWLTAITGFFISLALLFMSVRTGLLRIYGLTVISVVASYGLSFLGYGDLAGLAVYYALMGALLVASGGLTLRTYLRHTKPFMETPPNHNDTTFTG